MDIDNIVHLTCSVHPGYQLKRKPTSSCEECWDAWLRKRRYLRERAEDQARAEREDRYSR